MRLIFIGTSSFALSSLNKLHESHYNIIRIITQPDRLKGRGQKKNESPIKKRAIELKYKIYQPIFINEKKFINKIKLLNPDLFVVLSFGQILSKEILEIPKRGAINIHPSLIPKYRGAAPIQWNIINREKKTGVTTMFMDKKMDSGPILMFSTTNIKPNETTISLKNKLSIIASKLLIKTLRKIENNSITAVPQNNKKATVAPLLKKKDGEINWNDNADKIESFIRGINPWPGAFTYYEGKYLKILEAKSIKTDCNYPAGMIINYKKNKLHVATKKHIISIKKVQSFSGKKLHIKEFLCGHKLRNNVILGS